jgi:hypothetical protein
MAKQQRHDFPNCEKLTREMDAVKARMAALEALLAKARKNSGKCRVNTPQIFEHG